MKNKKFIKNLSKAALVAAFTFTILGFSNTTAKAADDFNARIVKTKTAHMYSYTNGKFKDTGKTVAISTILKNPTSKSSYLKGSGKNYWVKESDCTAKVRFEDITGDGLQLHTTSIKKCKVYYIPTTKGDYAKQEIQSGHSLGINYVAINHDDKKFYVTEKGSYIEPGNVNKALLAAWYAAGYDHKIHYTQANRYLGPNLNSVLYRFVGTKQGVDCSSFCYSVYSHFGFNNLPTSTWGYKTSSAVKEVGDKQEKKPGDILWKSNGDGTNHVELYLGKSITINGKTYTNATVGAHECKNGDHKGDLTIVNNNAKNFSTAYRVFDY